jgi:hypothetical protein|tara:strand:+ start:141 stop:485 length:345 start_codon:yes stop_codon:yes gene_type:complete
MTGQQDTFYKRLCRIARQHNMLSRGYVLKLNKDNLIVPHPHFTPRAFPWKALFVSGVIALGFKAYIMAVIDEPTYTSKLVALSQGHALERAGAWVMQRDPATDAVARVMRMMRG